MPSVELAASWSELGLAVLSTVAIVVTVVTYTRVSGLRSFSKMSSFDFAVTVAIGSTMASTAMSGSSFAVGATVLGTFYVTQLLIALGRRRWKLDALVDNDPRFVMVAGRFLDDALDETRVTRGDVLAKLREANCFAFEDARAVILETTGDISVIHGDGPLDMGIFEGVVGHELLAAAERRRGGGGQPGPS